MANPNRPRGFTPVAHENGASWNNSLAVRAMVDATAFAAPTAQWKMGIGTAVVATTAAAADTSGPFAHLRSVVPMQDGSTTGLEEGIYGVVVGIGHPGKGDTLNGEVGPWNPADLGGPNYITDADVTADPNGYVLYIAPAFGWIFECQLDGTAIATIGVGDSLDINMATSEIEQVDTATGRSVVELLAGSGNNVRIVGIPERPDNDPTLANVDLHVVFKDPYGWQAALR